MPTYSRHVGQALKFLNPDAQPPVPWYRVIGSSGTISSRGPGTDGANRQRQELEAEGVEVTVSRSGEMRIDLGIWGWFPTAESLAVSSQSAEQPLADTFSNQDGSDILTGASADRV